MSRILPNFLDAYCRYASDGFCPPQFHLWTGVSVIAGALERKVWIKQNLVYSSIYHYPNLFVFLVSHPGIGKSTGMDRGMKLLRRIMQEDDTDFKFIANQGTEPAVVEDMAIQQSFQVGSTLHQHSSGYFYASEASSSALQNTHGDFVATLTAFYDCPELFKKSLKSGKTELVNVCFNLLAGATFQYLKNLVNEDTALGGFASRCLYVVSRDRKIRNPSWVDDDTPIPLPEDRDLEDKLYRDLCRIHKLTGKFRPTREFVKRWEAHQPKLDQFLIDLKSPRLESLYARKGTNLLKLCMVLSAAERDDLVLTEHHWDRALSMIEEVTADTGYVLSSAIASNVSNQSGVNQVIIQALSSANGKMPLMDLMAVLMRNGVDAARLEPTKKALIDAGKIQLITTNGKSYVKLLVDADAGL